MQAKTLRTERSMPRWKRNFRIFLLLLGGSGCSTPERDFKTPPDMPPDTPPDMPPDMPSDMPSDMPARCGDGKVDPGEVCDAPTSSDRHHACNATCSDAGCLVGVDYPSIQAAV